MKENISVFISCLCWFCLYIFKSEFTVLVCQGEAGAPGSKGPQGERGLKVSWFLLLTMVSRYFSVPFFKNYNIGNLSGYCRRRGSIWKSRAIWKRGIIDVKCCSDIFPCVFKVLILSWLVFSPSPGLFWFARLNGHSRNPRTKGVVICPL